MCTPIGTWWLIFFVLTGFGAIGGMARHIIDSRNGNHISKKLIPSLIIGTVAGLVVPLFLNASSSSVIKSILGQDATEAYLSFLHLIGYSVLAGLVGNHFLTSMAVKALQSAVQAQKVAEVANEVATEAIEISQASVKEVTQVKKDQARASLLISPIDLMDNGRYDEAALLLEQIIGDDPQHSEAFAWLAYCYKRMSPSKLSKAIEMLEIALILEKDSKPSSWLYNLGCYKSLFGASTDEIVVLLKQSFDVATVERKKEISRDLKTDRDLDSLRVREDSTFLEFLDYVMKE